MTLSVMHHRQNTSDSTGSFRIYVQKKKSGPCVQLTKYYAMKACGDVYIYMNFRPPNWLEVSDKLHDSAALPLPKESLVHSGYKGLVVRLNQPGRQ
jgi:hypothetical protein